MKTRILAVCGLAAVAPVFAAQALGTIPAPNGTITGCFKKGGGPLRVVQTTASCTSTENSVRWNQGPSSGLRLAQGSASLRLQRVPGRW